MRFVDIKDRNFFSIISNFSYNFISDYGNKIKDTKWNYFKWKNLTLMKDPMTLSIYMQLIQDIKPKTIIEFGTYEGGSALWMNDVIKNLNLDCKIYTFDIDDENVKIESDEILKYYHLDNYQIKSFVRDNQDLFLNLQHPILVIEDSHCNVEEVLTEIDAFLIEEDYLIIEDTIDEEKYHHMINFLKTSKNYKVDTYYCDFWGQNNTWNINSFLKKIKK